MAAQIRAHVTLAYPQEAPLADLLVARLRAASYHFAPFQLRLGALAYFEHPEDGVYIEVQDIDRDYCRLRQHLLCAPFQPIAFPPHVTLIHPRTSAHGREFWNHGRYQADDEEVQYHVYLVLAWSGIPVNQQPDEHTTIAWFSLDRAVQLELAHPTYPQLFARVLGSVAQAWRRSTRAWSRPPLPVRSRLGVFKDRYPDLSMHCSQGRWLSFTVGRHFSADALYRGIL
jgi:hypothetical protein